MELPELLAKLKADPKVGAMVDAATPYLKPMGRLAWDEIQNVIKNLAGHKFSEAHLAVINACENVEEMLALQRVGKNKALQAALDEYAKTKAAKEMLLRLLFAVALAAI